MSRQYSNLNHANKFAQQLFESLEIMNVIHLLVIVLLFFFFFFFLTLENNRWVYNTREKLDHVTTLWWSLQSARPPSYAQALFCFCGER